MKKFPFIVFAIGLLFSSLTSCLGEEVSNWDTYADWRNANLAWLQEMSLKTNPDGTPYYKKVSHRWYQNAHESTANLMLPDPKLRDHYLDLQERIYLHFSHQQLM